ncbi:hypothetical protein VPH35_077937 [Triticum aestivum]
MQHDTPPHHHLPPAPSSATTCQAAGDHGMAPTTATPHPTTSSHSRSACLPPHYAALPQIHPSPTAGAPPPTPGHRASPPPSHRPAIPPPRLCHHLMARATSLDNQISATPGAQFLAPAHLARATPVMVVA